MNVTRNTSRKNVIYIILVLVIGFFALGTYIMLSGLSQANKSSERFASYYINEKKELVKNEVENRLDEIEYELANKIRNEQDELKNKTNQIAFLLEKSNINDIADPEERKIAFINEFYNLVIFNNKGYFAMDTTGKIIFDASDDDSFYSNSTLVEGNHIKDMLKAIGVRDGVFVTYDYPNSPNKKTNKITSYCLYLPSFDLIIGTKLYEADVQARLKDEILARLQSYYIDQDNYIFVTDYNSVSRVSGNPDAIGTKMNTYETPSGENLHQLFIETANSNENNYLTYEYYKKGTNELTQKTSYIRAIDEWDCYIGMGFYMDDLNETINDSSREFKSHHYYEVFYIFMGLIFIAILILLLVKRGEYLQKEYLQHEEIVFTKLIELTNEAILIISMTGEILYNNAKTHMLFGDDIENYLVDSKLTLQEVEQSIYSIQNQSDRVYYVELKKEKLSYHGTDSYIYFINNITTTYIKSHEFEKLTLIDELSKLPNRRALINDFDEKYNDRNEDTNTIIGMIDLDNFKKINDQHGHDVGDEVIRILSDIFNARLRQTDKLYRYGGEEFIVIMDYLDIKSAQRILMDMNGKFHEEVNRCLGFNMTFSCGITKVDWSQKPFEMNEIIKEADLLLYKAKNGGRNKVEM